MCVGERGVCVIVVCECGVCEFKIPYITGYTQMY